MSTVLVTGPIVTQCIAVKCVWAHPQELPPLLAFGLGFWLYRLQECPLQDILLAMAMAELSSFAVHIF